jgi:simple sugar transport system ATP-binding protein
MAEMMIGGSLKDIRKGEGRKTGAERFAVRDLTLAGAGDFDVTLKSVSFAVHAGEILGIAGVAGNGQNELLLALSGETPVANAGAITLDGKPIGDLGVGARRRFGLCAVPEERNGHAAVPGFSLADNAVLTARYRKAMVKHGVISAGVSRNYAEEIIRAFGVKATGPAATAGSLSGGNLQKYIMGREVLQVPEVLVVSQPTWGVDAGAAAAIHQALVDLAARGSALVVVSQDLDELLAIADSLAVINEGRLSPKRAVGAFSIDEIGLLMGGVHGDHASGHVVTPDFGAEARHA